MFKSTFIKYTVTFIMIIVIFFLMMLSIILSLVHDYSSSMQIEIAENAAAGVEEYIEFKYNQSSFDTFDNFIEANENEIVSVMSLTAENFGGMTVMLTDENGAPLLFAASEDSEKPTPPAYISKVLDSSKTSYSVDIIDNKNGDRVVGSIVVVQFNSFLVSLLETMIKTITVSSVWLLLATLIAVYFITEMVTEPLREMSKAAKSFSVGKFDVRVPVRGQGEVADLATAFNNMASGLNELEESRNAFISNVAHELRTPMTTISGFIDNILLGAIPKEEQDYHLQIVKDEVLRLSRLVSSLLDITRLQSGTRRFTATDFDICELARIILISFEQKIENKSLDVCFECECDRIYVSADRDAIHQVLYNICDNAVKFSRENGKLKIRIGADKNVKDNKKKKITVSVYNEGQGIVPESIPFVFERFYKEDKSRGMDKNGVGLGMYIAKTIMDAHNERIWVESVHGEYCEFSFTLTKSNQQASLPSPTHTERNADKLTSD